MSDLATRKAATAAGQPSLSCDSKAAAVAILKTSPTLDANTKMVLTPYMIDGIISGEWKRLGWREWAGETILPSSIDPSIPVLGRLDLLARKLYRQTGGQGPGQLYPAAYNQVLQKLKPELDKFFTHMGVNCGGLRRGCGEVPLTLLGYPRDVIDPIRADFFIAATLAIKIMDAKKPGRTADDQLQFGIGRYRGAFDILAKAQRAISPDDDGKSVLRYPPVREWLLRSSDPMDNDVAAYIQEVFGRR
ncbi:hypothetical protein FHP25_32700 [Vineibacter terrae]|uniref:Uncharacterized protein n=1 Tax=Vineibacter terrae TaxID=2586908 RepID=A0A5C8PAT1_9HYPH|nr:hypothetical protein [Vineibacter terrae]TXL70881.1 hypothetical protein FHP25_32700 [Vineibacter terrae]